MSSALQTLINNSNTQKCVRDVLNQANTEVTNAALEVEGFKLDLVTNASYTINPATQTAGNITKVIFEVGSVTTAGTYTISKNGTPISQLQNIPIANNTITLSPAEAFTVGTSLTITFSGTVGVNNFGIWTYYTKT